MTFAGWVPDASPRPWYLRLWDRFWAIPVVCVALAIALGLTLPRMDSLLTPAFPHLFHGGPDGARAVLSTITTAMISVTGLVFSITMVVVQLASSQFSPRVLGTFLRSRITQLTLGVFTGTFMYSLTALRSIRDPIGTGDTFVPQVATTFAYVLVIASVGFFLAFIHHITSSIQVASVIEAVRRDTAATCERMLPEGLEPSEISWAPQRAEASPSGLSGPDVEELAWADDGGHVTDVDYRRLLRLAREHDITVELTVQVGEYVPRTGRLARVERIGHRAVAASTEVTEPCARTADANATSDGETRQDGALGENQLSDEIRDQIVECVAVGCERSLRQDPAFGFRQLVDIAERALSPGVNDPTTAVQSLNALHSLLRVLVARQSPSGRVVDEDGTLRLLYRPQSVAQLLDLATEEIIHWGKGSIQVPRRMLVILDDLEEACRQEYRPQLRRIRTRALQSVETPGGG